MKTAKGWFQGLGRDGDRSISQQMIGLEQLLLQVPGKSVLDAGCAEGLISIELARAGAASCVGLERVASYIPIAQNEAGQLPCSFVCADLNEYDVAAHGQVDIVIMLAILHKLKNPSTVCAALAALARDLVVIRLPPYGMVIRDARSNNEPHDIGVVMASAGFELTSVVAGPRDEWLGYFRRMPVLVAEPDAPEMAVDPVPVAQPVPVNVMQTPAPETPGEEAEEEKAQAQTRPARARRSSNNRG